jgi:energy-coupling factor transport system ATP-binding protein
VIFQNASCSFHRGEVTGVIGYNSVGKTTLIELICGLKRNTGGTFILDGKPISNRARIAHCYYVMQDVDYQIFTESVWEELMLSASGENAVKNAEEMLERLNLSAYRS